VRGAKLEGDAKQLSQGAINTRGDGPVEHTLDVLRQRLDREERGDRCSVVGGR
jgi:hypothetical protein